MSAYAYKLRVTALVEALKSLHTSITLCAPIPPRPPFSQKSSFLPDQISITQVYDQAGSELLILGGPGVGKTTLLLHLLPPFSSQREEEATQRHRP